MKRINLLKYGFIRDEESDFEDDGNKFICYKPSEDSQVRVSKLIDNGEVYLSGVLYGKLLYDEYSELPHYNNLDEFNGYPISDLTDEDLYRFKENCLTYEKEFREAEANIKWPTKEELDSAITMIKEKRDREIKNIYEIGSVKKILNLNNNDFDTIKTYISYIKNKSLSCETQLNNLDNLVKNYTSRNIIKNLREELKDSYWYLEVIKIISK